LDAQPFLHPLGHETFEGEMVEAFGFLIFGKSVAIVAQLINDAVERLDESIAASESE